jgi:hypothetical protein
MTGGSLYGVVPPALVEAYRHRVFLSTPELARLLEMNVETLFREMEHGNLPWHQKGQGQKSPRRIFTLDDVMTLLRNMQNSSKQKGERAWHEEDHKIIPFTGKTSRGGAKPMTGSTASTSQGNHTTVHAKPSTSGRPKSTRPSSKRQRNSMRAEI